MSEQTDQWERIGYNLFQEGWGSINISVKTRGGALALAEKLESFLNAPAPAPIGKEEGRDGDEELARLAKEVRTALDVYAKAHGIGPEFNRLISALLARVATPAPAAGASPVGGPPQELRAIGEAEISREIGYQVGTPQMDHTLSLWLSAYRQGQAAAPSLLGGGVAADKWINVEDGLPEKGTTVWVAMRPPNGKYKVVRSFFRPDGYWDEFCPEWITDWQPYYVAEPAPPKTIGAAPTQVAIGGSGQPSQASQGGGANA